MTSFQSRLLWITLAILVLTLALYGLAAAFRSQRLRSPDSQTAFSSEVVSPER